MRAEATIDSSRVDLHTHVLPGIDDGAADVDESLAMLRAAASAGTAKIAATPHLHADFPDVHVHELAERCGRLREAAESESIGIELVSGAEVSLTWAFQASDEELRLATYGGRGTDILIETPPLNVAVLGEFVGELSRKGLRTTLAHPERSVEFQFDPSLLRELVAQGVLLQVDAAALLRSARAAPDARLGRLLCTEGLAHALASDGHRADGWRPITDLMLAARVATDLVGAERARWLTEAVPAAIITGTKLPQPPPVLGRPGFLQRVFGPRN